MDKMQPIEIGDDWYINNFISNASCEKDNYKFVQRKLILNYSLGKILIHFSIPLQYNYLHPPNPWPSYVYSNLSRVHHLRDLVDWYLYDCVHVALSWIILPAVFGTAAHITTLLLTFPFYWLCVSSVQSWTKNNSIQLNSKNTKANIFSANHKLYNPGPSSPKHLDLM